MEGNDVNQATVKNVMTWLKDDLQLLNNECAGIMLEIIADREKKHFELHYDLDQLAKVLQHDTQTTFIELKKLISRMNLVFGINMNEQCIWKYKNRLIPENQKAESLREQYRKVCKQTEYMCKIMECLVVSEAEIERVNSHMRRQLHYQRSKIVPATLERLLYIKYSNFSWKQYKESAQKPIEINSDEESDAM
ncbi:Hypothetical_protein [Hexamita inflata]|uniref:Hypothetical_protein n=1 Tax=Hexamita inflata TaxID=28002 RepID=A0AA86UGB5_9EUKA|nr:Hypothetical protein HINF_LOCUS38461 [Hexamita inflata]